MRCRDALFLTWFQVTTLPYFMAAAAVLAIPAAESSGRLLARFGPARVVPFILGVSSALFLVEWSLLGGYPRVGVGARLRSRQCAGRDRDLGVLVDAQRALRPALGQAAHGASGRGGRLWRPGWRRRRGARDGPHVAGSALHVCWDCRAPRAWRVPCSSVAECLRGVARPAGAGGPPERMGRDPARAAASRSRPRGRARRGARRAGGLPAQGGSRSLARQGRAARALLRPLLRRDGPCRVPAPGHARPRRSSPGSGSAARWPATRCWWARPVCWASLPRRHGAPFFHAASM